MERKLWRRPVAGLTAKQAARTEQFRRARQAGAGIVDAIVQARWSDALRRSVLASIREAKRRTAAAKRGWRTRRRHERELGQ